MGIGKENYHKFPALLRAKLENGDILFPEETKFEYESIVGYRSILRETGDETPVNRNDMRSYAELGKIRVGALTKPALEKMPIYYGISFFTSLDKMKQGYKMGSPKQRLAVGRIYMEGGPELTKDSHVTWWLYESVSFESFKFYEEN